MATEEAGRRMEAGRAASPLAARGEEGEEGEEDAQGLAHLNPMQREIRRRQRELARRARERLARLITPREMAFAGEQTRLWNELMWMQQVPQFPDGRPQREQLAIELRVWAIFQNAINERQQRELNRHGNNDYQNWPNEAAVGESHAAPPSGGSD